MRVTGKDIQKYLPLIGLIVLVLLAAVPVLTYPMGRDQGMYANIGRTILRGGLPYIDMWDIKPPPIYYIYAMGIGIFGTTAASIRAIDFTLIPLGMLGLFLIGERLKNQRLGLVAALLYGVFYFNEDFQNLTQSDSLVTVFMIWAAYTTFRAMLSDSEKISWRWAFISGFICGFVLWFKHYYAFFVLALVINRLIANRKGLFRDGVGFAIGGLLSGGSMLLYFWRVGIIREMLIVAQGTAAYNAQGYDFGAFIANMQNYWYFRWQTWHGLLILVLLYFGLKIFTFLRKTQTPAADASTLGWRLIFSWLISAIAFALIQAKGFDTHWIPMLPAMALLGADTIDMLIRVFIGQDSSRKSVAIVVNGVVVIVLLSITAQTTWGRAWRYITGQETRVEYFDHFQANDLKPEESLLMAQYLRERVSAGDSLFIWGFRPEVYYMAQLNPATRYQAHFPLVAHWYPPQWREDNVEILRAALPPYALILEDDFMPWVTDIDADSHTILQDSTHDELRFWYQAHYEEVEEIGDFIIWKRKSP